MVNPTKIVGALKKAAGAGKVADKAPDLKELLDRLPKGNKAQQLEAELMFKRLAEEKAAQSAPTNPPTEKGKAALRDIKNYLRESGKQKFLEPSAEKRVMYHGTAQDISEFRPGQTNAIFLSSKPEFTEEFAEFSEKRMIREIANELDKNPDAKRDLLIPIIDQAIAEGRLATPENTNGLVKTTRDQHIAYALDKPLGVQLTVYGYGNELSDSLRARLPSGMNVMPVHVQARNPFDYENPEHVDAVREQVKKMGDEGFSKEYMSSGRWNAIEDEAVQEAIKDLGFDAFYVNEGGTKNLGVYDPNRIKSAIGNRGTYDITDPDITKKKGGAVKKAEGGTVSYELPDDVTPQNWRDQLETNVLNDARALIGVKEGGPINLDRLLEKAVRKANGGPANLDDMLKWAVAKHNHKMKKGGEVSQTFPLKKDEEEERMFSPAPLKIPEPITDALEALKRQFEKEKRSMSKPGAVQDVLMRGPVAMYAGAPADIVGMGGEALDWLQTKIPGMRKPASVMDTGPEKVPPMGYAPAFPLAPEGAYGTEAAQELMKQSGLTTGTERPLFETGAAVAAPFAGMAAVKTGKALAPTAKEMTQFALEKSMEPYQMNIIKPEGGNWVKGAAEKYLKDLRYDESLIDPVGVMNPTAKAEETARVAAMNNFVDKKLSRYLVNQMGTPSDPLRLQADTWAETQKKLLADKDKQIDKVRSDIQKAQRERGVDPEVLTRSQARLRDLRKERELIQNRKGLHYEPLSTDVTVFGAERRRKDLGAPRERMAKSEIGQNWEDRADLSVQQSSYMKQPEIGVPKTYAEFVEAAAGDRIVDKAILDRINTELEKMGGKYALENPEALAYRTTGDPSKVGFDHMMDEIDNALRPSQGLPEYLQLKPKDLDKMSVAQVSEHVDKINAWRASQKAEVDAARAANAATVEHKAYDVVPGTDIPNDQGLRWVEIKVPELVDDAMPQGWAFQGQKGNALQAKSDDGQVVLGSDMKSLVKNIFRRHPDTPGNPEKAVEDALKYEGEILQHCVGGYCPDVIEGRSRIFSLRDADGRPHATIEVEPPEKLYAIGGEEYERLDPQTKGQYREYVRQWRQRNPDVDELTDEHVVEALKEAGVPPNPEKITQIKGLQNRKPNDEYMPFIQDFVKSGQWSDVGDIHHTGLRDSRDVFNDTELKALQSRGREVGKYLTPAEIDELQATFKVPSKGMKRGGRVIKADLEQQFRMAFGGGVFNTDPDITDSGRIIPEHTI